MKLSPKFDVLYQTLCGWCEEKPYSLCVSFHHGICSGWSHIPVVTLDCIPLCHLHIFNTSFHIFQPCLLTLVTTRPTSCFMPVCFMYFALTPLANVHPFLICTLSFPFNANWLVYVQLFGLLFLWQYRFWFKPPSSGTQLGRTATARCIRLRCI